MIRKLICWALFASCAPDHEHSYKWVYVGDLPLYAAQFPEDTPSVVEALESAEDAAWRHVERVGSDLTRVRREQYAAQVEIRMQSLGFKKVMTCGHE